MVDQRSLLFHRDFRLLWGGVSISQFATQVTLFALPLLAVTELHAGPLQVGLVTTCATAAFLVVGLPVGAWVDRVRRRGVLILGDLGRGLLLGSLPLAAALGALTLAQLYAVAIGVGILTVFFDVADQSYLPHVVGRERLVDGNAKMQASHSVADVSGPGLGGLIAQVISVPLMFLMVTASFLSSSGCVGLIRGREPKPPRPERRDLRREVLEGLRFVLGHRLLRAIAACTGSHNFCSTMVQAMVIVLLARGLALPAGTVGLFFTIAGLGGVAGAAVARRVALWLGQGPAIWMSVGLSTPFGLLIPLAANGWRLWLAGAGFFMVAVGGAVYNVTQVSFRQRLCPERMLGRMNATMRFLVWGTMPLGGAVGGALGSLIGVRPTLWVATAGASLAFLPVLLSPLRRLRELPTDPAEATAAATL
ncbi:MAG: MFS transporter [Streptosporangiaceae bacterium]